MLPGLFFGGEPFEEFPSSINAIALREALDKLREAFCCLGNRSCFEVQCAEFKEALFGDEIIDAIGGELPQ